MPKAESRQKVYTLLVEVGRKTGDGLPDGATGAALMCYASGIDEAEAVRETVAILKQADLAPLDVSGYGTLEERLEEGHDIDEHERALMARSLEENAVIVAQMTPFYDEPGEDEGEDLGDPDDETPPANANPVSPVPTTRRPSRRQADKPAAKAKPRSKPRPKPRG